MSQTVKGDIIGNVNDAYIFASTCAPFEIRKAVLREPLYGEREVYLIGLRGTDQSFDTYNPLSIPTCLKSAVARENTYTRLVKNRILKTVPKGSSIVFIAHSLGGMVCQQLGVDTELKASYHILHILTMGSPWVIIRGKKTPFHRMADHTDMIPHLFSTVFAASYFFGNVTHEYGGYIGDVVKSHCDSYHFSPVWQKYDCFGVKYGRHSLLLKD